jgi:hypothetical protein
MRRVVRSEASQASDVGSIPIARSINPVDAVGFTGFPPLKVTSNCSILDAVGREIPAVTEFWTRSAVKESDGEPRKLELPTNDPSAPRPAVFAGLAWKSQPHTFVLRLRKKKVAPVPGL